ncbi:MAG: complex I subunit 5 family protein [Bacillota bacterium]
MNLIVLLLIVVPLTTAFLIPLIDLINKKIRKYIVFISINLEAFIAIKMIVDNFNLLKSGELFLQYHLGGWVTPYGINLVVDSVALFFVTLITFALYFIIIYSIGFIGHHEGKYYVLLFLIFAAMQGVIITGDLFNLYVFIELIAVTSAPLVAFKRSQNSTEAAIKYMIYGIIGGLFFFIGVVLIYFSVGSLNMAEVAANFSGINFRMQLFIITTFLVSFFIKLGIFPFHFWLPKAHSACPSSISALLSGVLLKVYLYAFIRIFWTVLDYNIVTNIGLDIFIIYISLFSSLLGHIFALQADDIKRMLAFSTIGHIGMITAALALDTEAGFYGAMLHIIAHLLMKSGLFMGVGYLINYVSGHKIEDFTGIAYRYKGILISIVILSLGMIGIPPIIGFMSKWYILLAFLEANSYLGAALVIIGSLTAVIYYMRYIARAYQEEKLEPNLKNRGIFNKPIISTFYKERIVMAIVFIFAFLVISTGITFKIFNLPINSLIPEIINPQKYIDLVLG